MDFEAHSFALLALVICELLGVTYADGENLRQWSDDAADMTDEALLVLQAGAQRQCMLATTGLDPMVY